MAYVAVDKDGNEYVYDNKPIRRNKHRVWDISKGDYKNAEHLPNGSIEKLIGKKLTWEDEPAELKKEN